MCRIKPTLLKCHPIRFNPSFNNSHTNKQKALPILSQSLYGKARHVFFVPHPALAPYMCINPCLPTFCAILVRNYFHNFNSSVLNTHGVTDLLSFPCPRLFHTVEQSGHGRGIPSRQQKKTLSFLISHTHHILQLPHQYTVSLATGSYKECMYLFATGYPLAFL